MPPLDQAEYERENQQAPTDTVDDFAVNTFMVEIGFNWDDERQNWYNDDNVAMYQKAASNLFDRIEELVTRRSEALAAGRLPDYYIRTKGVDGLTVVVEGKDAFDLFVAALVAEREIGIRIDEIGRMPASKYGQRRLTQLAQLTTDKLKEEI